MRRFGCMLAAIVKQMRMKYSRRKHATTTLTKKIEKVLKIKIMCLKNVYIKRETNCSCFQRLPKVHSLQNASVATYNLDTCREEDKRIKKFVLKNVHQSKRR